MPFHGYQGRTQWAVYWARIGSDGFGEPTVSDVAQEVRVRWDGTSRGVLGPDGAPLAIDATVSGFTFDPVVGSLMWAGRLADLPGTSQRPAQDVMRIVTVNITPDVRGRSVFREATLVRTKDVLGSTGDAG